LLKTAADQKAVEGKLTTLNEELTLERSKSAKLEATSVSSMASLAQLTASLAETEGRLLKEQQEHQEVRKTLTALRAELDTYVEMEEQRLLARSAREAEEAAASSSSSFSSTFASGEEAEKAIALQNQLVADLQKECASLRQREKTLQLEMKKKGDLARSLIKEKDEEVIMWKRKATEGSSNSSSSNSAVVASPVVFPSPAPSPSHFASSVNSPLENGGGSIGGGSSILANLIINEEMDAEERKMAILSVFSKEQSRRQHLQAELDEAKKAWKKQEEVLHERVRELRSEMERTGVLTSSGCGGGGGSGDANSLTSSSSSSSSTSVTSNSNSNTTVSLTEREQEYLRQAFVGLFLAKQDKLQLEMQHLGRVLCALLKLSDQQKHEVLERINLLATAAVAKESLDSVADFVDLGKYAGFW